MSKVRISNPQTLNGEWFYIDGILYTITDFRWDGGWESGEFKGYLTTIVYHNHNSIYQSTQTKTFDIYFYMDTKKKEVRFEWLLVTPTVSSHIVFIPIENIDDLRVRKEFINLLNRGINKLIENNFELYKIVSSSDNYSGPAWP